jgi:hypothetical protein
MGCDIHCYIEYKPCADSDFWKNFGQGFNPGRNYGIFAKIAGVRNYDDILPVTPLKGYPENAAFWTREDYWTYIGEGDNKCTQEDAERWVASGDSRWNARSNAVSNPDWHSHTWLNLEEYKQVVSEFADEHEPEYVTILRVMESLESAGLQTRLVIWFDN